MTAPKRIQRKRTKGWRMPEGAIYVGRPSRWGNPYKGEEGASTMTREILADDFRRWLLEPLRSDPRDGVTYSYGGLSSFLGVPFAGRPSLDEIRANLAGRDLVCWCPLDQPCHADVLLEIANGGAA